MMEKVPLQELQHKHTIRAEYRSDIWRTPAVNDFNAPIKYTTVPFSRFRRARVTVSAAWKVKFDQGGFFLAVRPSSSSSSSSSSVKDEDEQVLATAKWAKAGVEVFNGRPYISTVVTDRYSDWSLTSLPSPPPPSSTSTSSSTTTSSSSSSSSTVTLELEREISESNGQPTNTLWIYYYPQQQASSSSPLALARVPCREVSWLFSERPANDEMLLGTYAAKVTKQGDEGELDVHFSDFEVELAPAH